jgi:cytochrome c553
MPRSMRVGSLGRLAAAVTLASLAPLAGIAQAPTAPPESGTTPSTAQGTTGSTGAATTPTPTAAAAAAPADAPFADGDAARGATKATVCSACHGPNGNSTTPEWPRLAGQNAVYIVEQLRLFRSGVRNNPVMKPLASTLSDQDIDDIAVYYEAQTPLGLEADPSYWQAGEALYLRGDRAREVPACVACHGPVGRGNLAAGYPALRAQQSVYVAKQLNDYASGARYTGTHPEAASHNGAMMFAIARRLSPEQIRDVASYVQGMR